MKKLKFIITTLLVVFLISIIKYQILKENYISQYGVEMYHDMNEEVGIENELDSYIYFVLNGK